jgi:leucyl aminopeptidase
MLVTAVSRKPAEVETDLLVVPLAQLDGPQHRLPARVTALDRALGGRISALVESGDFRGKPNQKLLLYPNGELRAKRVLLLGLGTKPDLDALRRAAGTSVKEGAARRVVKLALAVPALRGVTPAGVAQALAEGSILGGYRFDAYKEKSDDAPGEVAALQLCFDRATDLRAARQGVKRGTILAESQNVARDLSNQPGNVLPPAALARRAQAVGREVGLHVRVLGVPELRKRKMGAILAVGAGSANPPRLIVLEHRPTPAPRKNETICFVGKGVTFDSGGISIKPSSSMDEMKHDMSGAAAVIGALRACALLGVRHHVVGVIGAAENLPSGTAYRPGDILSSASGKTIEVLNTDAEGRIVLADALHYAATEFSPRAIVDLATLTGACVVALGRWATGLFGNNDRLCELVRRAGETTCERAWPLPLWEGHRKAVRSEVADVKNTGAGREAGSSTAAAFLAAFVGDTPWVHLDIAGTGWTTRPEAYQPRGATGVGVRLLLELLAGWKNARLK